MGNKFVIGGHETFEVRVNSNDDEMIAPRILFSDYVICTSASELLASRVVSLASKEIVF